MFDFAKKEFEKHYDSKMTVKKNQQVKEGTITKSKWVAVNDLKDIPCRISKKQITPVSEGEFAGISYLISLYCDPLLEIEPGSRISITDLYGVVREYKRSSEGFSSYRTHQEISIVRDDKA